MLNPLKLHTLILTCVSGRVRRVPLEENMVYSILYWKCSMVSAWIEPTNHGSSSLALLDMLINKCTSYTKVFVYKPIVSVKIKSTSRGDITKMLLTKMRQGCCTKRESWKLYKTNKIQFWKNFEILLISYLKSIHICKPNSYI